MEFCPTTNGLKKGLDKVFLFLRFWCVLQNFWNCGFITKSVIHAIQVHLTPQCFKPHVTPQGFCAGYKLFCYARLWVGKLRPAISRTTTLRDDERGKNKVLLNGAGAARTFGIFDPCCLSFAVYKKRGRHPRVS